LRGALFESFIISEFFKYNYNHNESPQIYFWRDAQGHEIDCVIEKSYNTILPIEIKSSKTISSGFFDGLLDWKKITQQENIESYVVYGGKDSIKREKGYIFSWNDLAQMLKLIYD
jgi:predicted AAA+ superfamily ATPase